MKISRYAVLVILLALSVLYFVYYTFSKQPTEHTNSQKYINNNLEYGFYYPVGYELKPYQDTEGLQILNNKIRIETLGTSDVTGKDTKDALLRRDLYCDADGPFAGIHCKNNSVEEFITDDGIRGYKVYRTKEVWGENAGTYNDYVYVFMLNKVMPGEGVSNISALLFYIDTYIPTKTQLEELDKLVNTVYFW